MALLSIFASLCLLLNACTKPPPPEEGQLLELSLYSGIRNFVSMQDTEAKILKRTHCEPERVDWTALQQEGKVPFSHVLFFKEMGTRVYFRNGKAALLEIQDPFKGTIQGTKLEVFRIESPKPQGWEQELISIFGVPNARASGGTFNSQALFYEWGDIAFNGNGPNELAIYRDPQFVSFRKTRFGRKIEISQ